MAAVIGGVAGGVLGGLLLADLLPNFWTESRPRGLPPEGVLPPEAKPGEVVVGPSSRPSAEKKGEKSLWKGKEEWRYHDEDKWHNPHWDRNPHDKPKSPWDQVPIRGLPPVKACPI